MSALSARSLDRVHDVELFGPDGQVDRKAIVLPPGQWADFDPFLMMAEDWFSSRGFDWHPHRGIETITFVIEGSQRHRDNAGHDAVLGAGDAEWMTAGRSIVHQELAAGDGPVHSMQLWLNLAARSKMVAPRAQQLRGDALPVVDGEHSRARVLAGRSGQVTGPAEVHWPVTVMEVDLDAAGSFRHDAAPDERVILYLTSGAVTVGGVSLRAGQVGVSHPVADAVALEIHATEQSHVLVLAGAPIGEPVVQHGPFVMNTRAEVDQALVDYHAGRFGPVLTN